MDINTLSEFSRGYCGSICAFLVPANVLTTATTLYLLYRGRSLSGILPVASIGLVFATAMFLHIATWLAIGVIMAPTFILFGLGLTCGAINLTAILDSRRFDRFLRSGLTTASRLVNWG